jgi:TonB family protein
VKPRGALVGVLIGSMLGAGACAHKPPTATVPSQETGARNVSLGPVYFDPQAADFTVWINQFKNEVYRNWVVPQEALGTKGNVDLEMTVERDGSLSALRVLSSTAASPIQDEGAQRAVKNSHFAALPEQYPGPRVTMQITFFYGKRPR